MMETYWLEGRQDMGEANETMVCLWRPKKKKSATIQPKSVSTDANCWRRYCGCEMENSNKGDVLLL
jgi:hypothetical protein